MTKQVTTDVLDYKEPITKIYFVRHGQTKANEHGLLFGQLDWGLNQTGFIQVQKSIATLKKIIKNNKIDCIISSPLKRTKQTSKIIAQNLKIKKIIFDKNLLEKSEGKWEGKSYWEIRETDPKYYLNWMKDPFKNRPPKGESVADLNKRIKKFYNTILKSYKGQNIIVVSHSGPIRLFILNLLGTTIDKFWHLKTECGAITEINVSKNHSMICSMNK